jgi:cytochrome c6
MQKLTFLLAVLATCAFIWSAPGAAADRQGGRTIYETYCIACHGEAGRPIDPTITNFANGDRLFQMDSQLLESIRTGNQTMPAFRGLLSDQEIRDVIAYLRTL